VQVQGEWVFTAARAVGDQPVFGGAARTDQTLARFALADQA